MSDIKWIKLTTNMFEDEKMRLIDAMPERDTTHYVWIRLLVQAGKTNSNGFIFLNEDIPYTEEMLSTIFCRPLSSIRLALKVLKDFRMIEVYEDNIIKITNWDKYQNVEGMERVREQNKLRAKNHRDKKKSLKEASKDEDQEDIDISENEEDKSVQNSDDIEHNVTENESNVTQNKSNVTVTEQNKRESKNKNQKKNKNSIIDREKESNNSHSLTQSTKDDVNLKAIELINYYEQITVNKGELNESAIRLAISIHGMRNVKMAINKAIECNKPNITYINGILKNWKREGYPSENDRLNNKSNSAKELKFNNFEPRQYDYDSLEKSLLGWND